MQAYAVYRDADRASAPRPPRHYARVAGILYLVTHVTSVAALVAYGAGLARLGVTLEFALAIGCAGTGVLLWMLLRSFGEVRALTFALLRAVEAAVIVAGALPMLALATTASPDGPLSEWATGVHGASFLLGQGLVISVNTIVLGWLLWDSWAVPRALATLGVVGGLLVLVSDLGQLWQIIPLNGPVAAAAAMPAFAFELWFAFYLIACGLREAPAVTVTTR